MTKLTSNKFEAELALTPLLKDKLEKIDDSNKVKGYNVSIFVKNKENSSLTSLVKDIKKDPDYWNDKSLDSEKSTGGNNSTHGSSELLRILLLSPKKSVESTVNDGCRNRILKLEPGESVYHTVKVEPEEIVISDDEQSVIMIDDQENSVTSKCAMKATLSPLRSTVNETNLQENVNHFSGVITATTQENRQEESPTNIPNKNCGNAACSDGKSSNNDNVIKLGFNDIQKIAEKFGEKMQAIGRLIRPQTLTLESDRTPRIAQNSTQESNRTPRMTRNSTQEFNRTSRMTQNSSQESYRTPFTVRSLLLREEESTTNNGTLSVVKSRTFIPGQMIQRSTIVTVNKIPFAVEVKEISHSRDPVNVEPFRKTCKKCGDNVFSDLNHFVDHLRHHNYSKMYCLVCQKGVCGPFYAEHHADIHHKNHVECNECFRFFPDAETLEAHRMDHKGKAPFRCEHCPMKLFLSYKQIKEHIEKCPKTSFKCNKCKSNFANKKELGKHTCFAENVHECPTCSKICESKTDLENHLKSHLEYVRSVYTCVICNSSYNSYNRLTIHRVEHILEYDRKITNFTCQICKKDLKNVNMLRKHVTRHSQKMYHCSVCQIGFTRQKHVMRHLDVHGKNYLRCQQCFQFYKDKRDLQCHERQHRMGPPYYCELCKNEFHSFISLHRHIKRDHLTFKCDICGKKFGESYKLTVHNYIHEKKYECKHCGNKFARQDYLMKHMTIHKKSRAFKCPVCKHKFSRSDNFKVHVRKMHRTDKTYKCPCGTTFEHKLLYQMHKAHHRGSVLRCDICSEKFKKFNEIKKHIMIGHLKYTNYTCDVCKEDFLKHESLISHYDKKHKSISSICDVCGLDFDSYSKLKDHKDTHEVENTNVKVTKRENGHKKIRKPVYKFSSYKCEHCGKVLNAMRILKHHILTEHFNAENYECNLCGAGFLSVKSLNNHYCKHHRNENVICDVCGFHFTKYGDFIKHKNKHEKDNVLECDKCSKTFLTAAQLKRHRLNTHKRAI